VSDLTRGPILPNLLAFALPIFVATSLQTVYTIVDALWVAQLGARAIGAVSVSYVVIFIMLSVAWGTTAAVTALVAQYFGARRRDMVTRSIGNGILLIGGIALALTGLVLALHGPILRALGTPPELYPDAAVYLVISTVGMPFMYAFTIVGAAMRGVGDSVTPMKLGLISNGFNVLADPVLIFGLGPFPRLEVAGAAWATLLAKALAALWGLWLLQRREVTRVRREDFLPDRGIIRNLLKIALPAGLTSLVQSGANSVVMGLVTPWGTVAVAAHGIGLRVDSLLVMPAVAMGLAAAPMVGQNLGAGLAERAYVAGRVALRVIFVLLTALGGIMALAGPWLVWPFARHDPAVVQTGALYFAIQGFFYGLFGVLLVLNHMLRGAGDATATLVLSFISQWVFRLPLAWVFAFGLGWGVAGVWWGIVGSYLLGGAVGIGYFRSRRWMQKAVVRAPGVAETVSSPPVAPAGR